MITVRFLVAGGSQLAGSQEIVRSEAYRSKYSRTAAQGLGFFLPGRSEAPLQLQSPFFHRKVLCRRCTQRAQGLGWFRV